MRRVAVVLALSLVTACAPAATAPAPAAVSATDVTILASDGAVMRPIANGGRVPLRTGWITVHFAPVPLEEDGELKVSVFDADGRPAQADVSVDYASMDMDHGQEMAQGVFHENCYQMHLSFVMPGRWRLVVHVARGGNEEAVTLILPEVGL